MRFMLTEPCFTHNFLSHFYSLADTQHQNIKERSSVLLFIETRRMLQWFYPITRNSDEWNSVKNHPLNISKCVFWYFSLKRMKVVFLLTCLCWKKNWFAPCWSHIFVEQVKSPHINESPRKNAPNITVLCTLSETKETQNCFSFHTSRAPSFFVQSWKPKEAHDSRREPHVAKKHHQEHRWNVFTPVRRKAWLFSYPQWFCRFPNSVCYWKNHSIEIASSTWSPKQLQSRNHFICMKYDIRKTIHLVMIVLWYSRPQQTGQIVGVLELFV